MKNHENQPARTSVETTPKLELKDVTPHLRYAFLGKDEKLPVIIPMDLDWRQVKCLVSLVKRFKQAIGYTIVDIIGIPLNIFSHKIQLRTDHKPTIEH